MYSEKLCKTFGYDKVLLMNGGVESGESAIKIARKWGYNKKNIKPNKACLGPKSAGIRTL